MAQIGSHQDGKSKQNHYYIRGTSYVVRLFDGFDNQWMDVCDPTIKAEADRIWIEKTKNGTKKTKYADIDYYKGFPADTRMIFSDGFGEI